MSSELQKSERGTKKVLVDTLQALAEGTTGLLTSSKNELILSIGAIFQRLRGGDFLSALICEWDKFKEKGRIKDDYQATEQHMACLGELLEFLDKGHL